MTESNKDAGVNPNDIIRKHVNDRIESDLTSKNLDRQEAAASAAWRLAEMDRKSYGDKLNLELKRTNLLAVSALTNVNIAIPKNAETPDAIMGPTLAQLRQHLNDAQNKKHLPPEDSIAFRRQIARLSPDKQQMWPEFTHEETAWLTYESEQNQRALNKLLISVTGPVASTLAEAAVLMNAPSETVKNLLEVGVGLTAASGLQPKIKAEEFKLARTALEPVSGYRLPTSTAAHQTESTLANNGLALDSVNTGMYSAHSEESLTNTTNLTINIKSNTENTGTTSKPPPQYTKGRYEETLKKMEDWADRFNYLTEQIEKLEVGDAERIGKESIRSRVNGYFRQNLLVLEKAKTDLKYEGEPLETKKSADEIKAFEARERLLTANHTPEIKDGRLATRDSEPLDQQQLIDLQQCYQQAIEPLWPKNLPIESRAQAPVLFKSDKLQNVYHITNPTGDRINCVSCTEALTQSIKGSPASANRYDDSLFHQVNNEILIKAHEVPQENICTDFAGVEKQLSQWGDGAIAVVAGQRDNFKGHNFVAVNDAGKVRFIDRQADNDLLSPKGVDFNQIVIIRVDNQPRREITPEFNSPSIPNNEYGIER